MTKKPPTPSEHVEQTTLVNWFRVQYPKALIFAIPNGELRAISVANRLKAEGVVSGIPDLCCIFQNGKVLWIEMKRIKGSSTSKEQKAVHEKMNLLGQNVVICKGYLEAIEKINEFNQNT